MLARLRPARLAVIAGVVLAVSVLAMAALALWSERESDLHQAQRDQFNLGHALAAHASQTLESVDLSLKAGLKQIHDNHGQGSDSAQNSRMLRAHSEALTSVTAIGLYGSQGEQWIGSTGDGGRLPYSLAGTESLAIHQSGRATGLHVSAPMRVGPDQAWQLILSRRVDGPRGEFRGLIAAMLDLKRYAEAYRRIDLGPNASLALLGFNGVLLASMPWREDLIARTLPGSGVAVDPGAVEAHTAHLATSPFDGRTVLVANVAVRGYPMTLSLMVDPDAVLAPWRRHAWIGGSAAVLIGVLAIALALLLDRHIRRRDESVARLRENQAELTEAHRIARLGSWRVEGPAGDIQWSAQAERLLGLAPVRVPTFERLVEHVLEDDRDRLRQAWAALVAGGDIDVEFRICPAPGEVRWLRARAEAAPPPAAGATFRARGTLLDVSEERRAEQALQHLASVVESTEDAILSVTADGRILSWNRGAARMFGYRADEAIGRRLHELMPQNQAAEAMRLLHRTSRGESIEAHETALTVRDGRRLHMAVTLSPLRDAAGTIFAVSAVARDITARREAERRRVMELHIVQALAESGPVAQTMPRILEALCRSLGLDCGVQWDLDPDGGSFRRVCEWSRPGADSASLTARLGASVPLTDSGSILAAAWRDAEPRLLSAAEIESCYAQSVDARSACASVLIVPITLGTKAISLIELRASRTRYYHPELLASTQAIGSQIGQYMERRRAEEELRAEKEYIGHVIASAPTLIACIAPDGGTRSVNPSIREIADFSPEEIEGRNFWLTLYGGADSSPIERLLDLASKGGVADYHLPIRTRLGELRDLSVSAAARRGADGAIVEYVLVGADITARRLDEARRAAEYAVARALTEEQSEAEAIPRILRAVCTVLGWECGVYRVFDPASRQVSCPYSWCKDTPELNAFVAALSAPRLLDETTLYWRTVHSRYPQWDNDLQGRISSFLGPSAAAAELCAAISVPVFAGERILGALQFIGRSGNRPPNVLIEAMQVIGHQVGQFIERKRVETAQKLADERLRGIAANIPGIVFEYRLHADGSAAFDYVSDRALDMLEEHPDTLIRDPRVMFRLVEPGYRRQLLRSMRASRHTRSLWLAEMPIRTRSGRVRWVRGQSMPNPLEDGSVVWDGVIVDVTPQKQAEQAIQQMNEQLERRVAERTSQLSAANRELESFAYSVSHDLRAPLRSIDGFSRILVEEFGPRLDPAAAEYLARVRNASQRMGQLIDDLLALSRVTRSELKRVRTDLSAIAEAVVQELRAEAPERVVDISVHPGMICLADPNLIRIALNNLIGNAWKFTSRRARASIEFGALVRRSKTIYYVRDNGAGFDMAHAGKLFGAFQRLHSTREFEGTGVGLATVSRIVSRHGGAVWAESAIDRGATFYFTLAGGEGRP